MQQLPFERIKREIFIKRKAKTDAKFGSAPEKRSVEELIGFGVVNINKPKGPTSHQVSSYVQKILGLKKSGHSGTLDPKVTGVLPVALGRATRIVQALLPAGKEYVVIMHLHKEADEDNIRKACSRFVGKIKQMPPIKSAIKREWRYRKIYYLDIIEIDGKDVLFRVGCQAGTYIRKLVHDIGQELKVGAHMAELIRTKAGPFSDNDMHTMQDLTDAYWYYRNDANERFIRQVVRPIEFAVSHMPKVWILDSTVNSVCHGSDVKIPGVASVESDIQEGEQIAVMTLKDELVATGTAKMISRDIIKKEKGIAVKVSKVFMKHDAYPKMA